MKEFQKHFEIIYAKFVQQVREDGWDARDIHKRALADFLEVSQGKMQAWQKGQWPVAEDLEKIAKRLGFSYEWLVSGQGAPAAEGRPAALPGAGARREILARDKRIAELEAEVGRLKDRLLDIYQEQVQTQDRYLALLREARLPAGEPEAHPPDGGPKRHGEPGEAKEPSAAYASGKGVAPEPRIPYRPGKGKDA